MELDVYMWTHSVQYINTYPGLSTEIIWEQLPNSNWHLANRSWLPNTMLLKKKSQLLGRLRHRVYKKAWNILFARKQRNAQKNDKNISEEHRFYVEVVSTGQMLDNLSLKEWQEGKIKEWKE